MILIKNLWKVYNTHPALHVPSLDIPSGQSFGLVGNNGAGKTTLFRCILDLLGGYGQRSNFRRKSSCAFRSLESLYRILS